ncbi:unnamed protein product, partial [Ectocarpus fasciculatus]
HSYPPPLARPDLKPDLELQHSVNLVVSRVRIVRWRIANKHDPRVCGAAFCGLWPTRVGLGCFAMHTADGVFEPSKRFGAPHTFRWLKYVTKPKIEYPDPIGAVCDTHISVCIGI